jgi:LPS export ABC transporter protein LptC
MTPGLSSANLINYLRYKIFTMGHSFTMAFSLLIVITGSLVFSGCDQKEIKEPVEYNGPLRIVENVELFYSENDRVKVKMLADLVHELKNGDREFPKGIYLEFFDEKGELESTLRANHAYYFKTENQWRGRGKVQVKNIAKNEQLNTEELFWEQKQERIHTDKFVTIRQQGDVIYGEGLEAKQDMSDYTILKPYGEFEVEEE